MRKIVLFLVSFLTVVATIVPFYLNTPEVSGATPLKRFSSYEELKNFLKASSQVGPYYHDGSMGQTFDMMVRATESSAKGTAVPPDYSTTNIQVEGVDEADIVKTDGTYIYVVSGNNIFIVKAYPPEEAQVLSKISFDREPQEIFIKQDKLAVFGSSVSHNYGMFTVIDDRTFVKVYNVSDRTNPTLTRNFSISGVYFNSRMINHYLYIVVSQPAYLLYDTLVLPKTYSQEGIKEIRASEIYYSDVSDHFHAFTTVVAVNLQNDAQEPTHKTFLLGATSCMYVSPNNIYITFWKGDKTLIYRIRIKDEKIECEADGEVPGRVLNQFSMDEYSNHFRIATTTWINGMSHNNLYVLDANLSIAGILENVAPTETIYSARFMGDRCYLVTFRQIDPFFVIDLKDPSSPKILGQLKIPGFSSYMHPYDENHILGIGKEEANVKISLFDVSNVSDPKEIGKYLVSGDWSESSVLTDHKVFLFDKSKKLLVIPVSVRSIWSDKLSIWQGAYVFNITLDEKIMLKGGITHLEDDTDPWASDYWVKRSLYIDNVLYTISDKKIKMNELENLDEINKVELL